MKFTVFIDESGETGISKVRTDETGGASPFFVMAAVVAQHADLETSRSSIENFRARIGKKKWKHATDLGHNEKVLLARTLGKLPVRYFAVLSKKETLDEYGERIEHDPHKYYNKCFKYLIERVLIYLQQYNVSEHDISVILERRNHDYGMMISFISTVKQNPIYSESKALKNFNPYCISTLKKGEDDMLEIADFVSHAVFSLVNKTKTNYGIPEPRYFQEICSRFGGNAKHEIVGSGIKCIHSLKGLQLDTEITEILKSARSKPAKRARQ
jgi:hypothetical protein